MEEGAPFAAAFFMIEPSLHIGAHVRATFRRSEAHRCAKSASGVQLLVRSARATYSCGECTMNTPIIKSTHARRDMSGFDDHNLEFIIDGFKNGRHSDERLYVNALASRAAASTRARLRHDGRCDPRGSGRAALHHLRRDRQRERRLVECRAAAMNKHLEAVVEWAARNGFPHYGYRGRPACRWHRAR